jgi:gluconate 2-dehydrogenase alpha chain
MDDNFDHTGLNFIGGPGYQSAGSYVGSGPGNLTGIAGSDDPTRMGSQYKASIKDMYLPTSYGIGLGGTGIDLANTTNYWDLDPTYVDAWGDPVARITHDWTPNMYECATYFGTSTPGNAKLVAILQKMGCTDISSGGSTIVPPYSAHPDFWGHHWRGGNRVGKSMTNSTFNGWQQCWAAPNLFAAGEVNNASGDTVPSGTHIAGPQVEIASEAMQMYLKSPGLLSSSPDGKPGPFT